jgi:putative transposase
MIQRWWDKLPEKFLNVETDAFVIMPNHIHGIMVLIEADTIEADLAVGADPGVGPEVGQTDDTGQTGQTHGFAPTNAGEHTGQGTHVGVPLPTVVQWFKTMTTNEYIRGVKELGWAPFSGKLWQRNYYEHIVRHERELNAIRQYIANNPLKWALDRDNPTHFPKRPPPQTVDDYLRDAGIS